jgi:hypothetical protein
MGHDGALSKKVEGDPGSEDALDSHMGARSGAAISPGSRATMARPNLGCRRS